MIISIILLILIILVVSLLLLFLFYILFPSIHNQNKLTEDPIISDIEKNYILPNYEKSNPLNKKAVVLCSCKKEFSVPRDKFNEAYSCSMVNSYNGTGTDCKFACIGLGDCVKICPQQAIQIKNRTAIISNLCIGCGKCIDACPINIIKLIPKDTKEICFCSNSLSEETSCSHKNQNEKLEWNDKKDFKIWSTCYKIVKHIIKN